MTWKLISTDKEEFIKDYKTIDDIKASGLEIKKVSGFGSTFLKDEHLWFFTEVNCFDFSYIYFEAIKGLAEVYINGEPAGKTNSYIDSYSFENGMIDGTNGIVLHFLPTGMNTAGILSYPEIRRHRKCEITSAKFKTKRIENDETFAEISIKGTVNIRREASNEFSQLKYIAKLKDGKNEFSVEGNIIGEEFNGVIKVSEPKVWFPKNHGRSYLYEASVSIYDGMKMLDYYDTKFGIRTYEEDLNINGKLLSYYGINWVSPYSRHFPDNDVLEKFFLGINDLNCNFINLDGQEVFEPEHFFELCDDYGIIVYGGEKPDGYLKTMTNHPSLVFGKSNVITHILETVTEDYSDDTKYGARLKDEIEKIRNSNNSSVFCIISDYMDTAKNSNGLLRANGEKKNTYYFVKKAINPLYFSISDQNSEGLYELRVSNDLRYKTSVTYELKDISEEEKLLACDTIEIEADTKQTIEKLKLEENRLYQIKWTNEKGRSQTNYKFTGDLYENFDTYRNVLDRPDRPKFGNKFRQ